MIVSNQSGQNKGISHKSEGLYLILVLISPMTDNAPMDYVYNVMYNKHPSSE
jgi:hypothetical protein